MARTVDRLTEEKKKLLKRSEHWKNNLRANKWTIWFMYVYKIKDIKVTILRPFL